MKKKITFIFITMLLVFPYYLGRTSINGGSHFPTVEATLAAPTGEVTSKDEVVYGSLNAKGNINEIYVVNMLDVTKPGSIIDYGNYSTVKNLTDLSEIKQDKNQVQLDASPGWFYYQGSLENQELPWDFDISYKLNGDEISADHLVGKDGRLLLTIRASKNENVNPVFHENYTMQISLTFDTDIISNIQAPDGTIANVGKKRQVTYTVMPGGEGEISLLADVVNFEMDGIDIFAIPLSMAIDQLEINDMTKELGTLSNAIKDVNKGVFDLNTGVSQLNNGIQSLSNGTNEYYTGLIEISNSSSEMINASKTIDESLDQLQEGLTGSTEEMDLSGLTQLSDGMSQIAKGLEEVANSSLLLQENFSKAYTALRNAINHIPASTVTDAEIQQLYSSGANQDTINHLMDVYTAAQTTKATFGEIKEAFDATEAALIGTSGSLAEISNQLIGMSNELSTSLENMEGSDSLSELTEGIAQLSSNYGEFHSGLTAYTTGVSQLAEAYKEINAGFTQVAEGTSELEGGVDELYRGTQELADATNELPVKMQEQINTMLDEYDQSNFEPVSFVSSKNENIQSVQFILKTEAIKMKEEDTVIVEEAESLGFWERLKNLFS